MNKKDINSPEDLAGKISDAEIAAVLDERAGQLAFSSDVFAGRVVRRPEDLPDTPKDLKLAILPPEPGYTFPGEGEKRAEEILLSAGANRRRCRNRVIFALPEADKIEPARDGARKYILSRGQEGEKAASEALDQAVRKAYSVLLVPESPDKKNCVLRVVRLCDGCDDRDWAKSAAGILIDGEALLPPYWDPDELGEHLDRYYFKKDSPEVKLTRVWGDLCRRCYMPRVQNASVLLQGILMGVVLGRFGCAAGKDDEEYQDLVIGSVPKFSPRSLLVSRQRAEEYYREEAWRQKLEEILEKLKKMLPPKPEEPDDE